MGCRQCLTVNNAGVGVVERLLVARYPHRKKLIRMLAWVERIAFASIVTYTNSADHVRQASANRRLARDYGYIPPQYLFFPTRREIVRARVAAARALPRFVPIRDNRLWYGPCQIAI
jgi:hypothetical protein